MTTTTLFLLVFLLLLPTALPRPEDSPPNHRPTNAYKTQQVQNAIRHAWHGYLDFAHLSDDLKPISQTGDKWLHARTTFYDALDTLYIAGLHNEFNSAISEIIDAQPIASTDTNGAPTQSNNLLTAFMGSKWWKPWKYWQYWHQGVPTSVIYPVKTFEYHIRIVGGLLGAYTMSGQRELLHSAQFAADCVLVAFNTPNGLPRAHTRIAHPTRTPVFSGIAQLLDLMRVSNDRTVWCNTLAGLGSFGIELRVLSRETGDPKYRQVADRLHQYVYQTWKNQTVRNRDGFQKLDWFVPPPSFVKKLNSDPCNAGDVGFGSGGDSYYEYLVKESLLNTPGPTDGAHPPASPVLMELYQALTHELHQGTRDVLPASENRVTRITENGRMKYMTNINSFTSSHLGCFAGGLLALGTSEMNQPVEDLKLAESITEQCAQSYLASPLGLGGETYKLNTIDGSIAIVNGKYQLRPEVVESLFVLWRITKDEKWREYGWNIFLNIEKHCKIATGGYSGIKNVNHKKIVHDDYQPSFFIAETLKYLFLMFAEDVNGEPLLPLGTYSLLCSILFFLFLCCFLLFADLFFCFFWSWFVVNRSICVYNRSASNESHITMWR